MRVETLESIHQLRSMRAEWDDLLARASNASIFGTFDWLEPWWTHFGSSDSSPAILVAREGRKIVAGLPLLRTGRRLRSMFNHYSGGTDLYLDAEYPSAIGAVFTSLRAGADRWDVLELDWIAGDSPLFRHLAHAELDGLAVHAQKVADSPYLELHGHSFERYYRKQFSAKTRSRDRVSLKELSEGPGFSLHTLRGREGLRESLEIAMGLETLGWKGEANSSMKQDPRVHAFVHEVCERAAMRGQVALTMLHSHGRPAAFVLGFVRGDTYYYFKTSYDPALTEFRPGRIVTNHALEYAFQQNLHRFEFLGASDEYKLRYTDKTRPHSMVFIHHDGLRSRLYRSMKRTAIPFTKQLLNMPGAWPVLIDRPGRPLG